MVVALTAASAETHASLTRERLMPPYFKPLRHKIGVLTLVMACVLTVGWVRSFGDGDSFDAFGTHFWSTNGFVSWMQEGVVYSGPSTLGLLGLPYVLLVIPLTLLTMRFAATN